MVKIGARNFTDEEIQDIFGEQEEKEPKYEQLTLFDDIIDNECVKK